ncbi:MAG: hypothetical protein N2109_04300 [Fimbriimonadales bacterium]|nr:hypothetical protein [Fimbriimonadales bacterium]
MPDPIAFRQGHWSFEVDPGTGFIRRVRFGRETLALAVYCAVRGTDWSTLGFRASGYSATPEGCSWTSDAVGAPFRWTTTARLTESGFAYAVEGEALDAFETCRTGVCVLHPMEVAGCPATAVHTDGTTEDKPFPTHISPHQPFLDLKELRYRGRHGHRVEIAFEGEVFEMEDQRNWSDASFKTYCRPLGSGRPYRLEKGQKLRHVVRIRCAGDPAMEQMPHGLFGKLPRLSVWLDGLADQQLPAIAALGQRRAATSDPKAAGPARRVGVGLDLLVPIGSWVSVAAVQAPTEDSVLWLVSDGWSPAAEQALLAARKAWGGLGWQIGCATSQNFTELNRSRPVDSKADWVGFAASPQVHAFDDWSIVENAATFAPIGETIRGFAGAARVAAMPIRFESPYRPQDPRAGGSVGALYTLLALAAASVGRLDAVAIGKASQLTDSASQAGEVLRNLAASGATQVEWRRAEGSETIAFKGGRTALLWRVNPEPRASQGLGRFGYRLEPGR